MERSIREEIRNSGYSLTRLADICPELAALKGVPQNPEYHAEGDVYRHTELVCETLITMSEWQQLPSHEQELLFLAAAFHDIGKKSCTKQENGIWVSPKHTQVGEKDFRRLAYRQQKRFGLTFEQREMVAKLIRYHGLPAWFWTKKRPEFALLQAAESIPLRLLYLLSKADVKGRICEEQDDLRAHKEISRSESGNTKEAFPVKSRDNKKIFKTKMQDDVELFAEYAKEQGIFESPYPFASPYTKFCYFQKEDLWQGSQLYDDTTFDVILMSGLPLSGKDTWIAKNTESMPVISLDQIREELKIHPAKGSDKVAHLARERARVFLRKKEPFVWNATNLIQDTRQKLIRLFAGYGARVHIVYLEAPYQELLTRNQKRKRYIPEPVLEEMIRKLEVPQVWEAYRVSYLLDTSASNEVI